jgi:hypothetical protein
LLLLFIVCVLIALGTIVLEPITEDFQEQVFDESQFLFVEQQGKCPLTISFAPMTLLSSL